jgi:xylan 1,4-beta-xylosidase
MKFNNPVLPGFYPDPSICRVGQDYYLVTSSFEYFPGVPLFHSRDLIYWRQIGHCLTRPSQLPLKDVPSSGGIYAPTLRYYQETFYMVTTNVTGGGHFYVHTRDPLQAWSEPIWLDQGGIDPSFFFDDDGLVYFTSTGDEGITQSRIDLETGRRLTEPRLIWSGTGGQYPEAPHLYKINGVYYLMIAEGGTEYGHMVTLARSDNPWGPFESCPHNPILTHRSYFSPIQATGHGDLIQAHDGRWWMVFLGIRPNGHPPCHHLGRETFLAPVTWGPDGWPVVGKKGRVALKMEAECLPPAPWEPDPARDDFDEPQLRLSWNFLRNPNAADYSLTERPGWLRLVGSALNLEAVGSPTLIGRRQQHFDCQVRTLVDFEPQAEGEEAGLTVRMNEQHHYEIAITRLEGERQVILRRRIGSLVAIVQRAPIESGPVILEIKADRNRYYFSCGLEGQVANLLGTGETRYLSTEVATGFTGVYFALYATGNGRRSTTLAFFDWFDYLPL